MATPNSNTIVCTHCKTEKPFSEFYVRSGIKEPTAAIHYLKMCKACRKVYAKGKQKLPNTQPAVHSEILTIEYLKRAGIPALPGKALHSADVDVIVYGCLWLECKFSRLEVRTSAKEKSYLFVATPRQQHGGFKADIVVLICAQPNGENTFHFFPSKHPVFYMKGRLKTGVGFRPGQQTAIKHGNNRVVMTQSMMDTAQDATWLIKDALIQVEQRLKNGETLPYELNSRKAS